MRKVDPVKHEEKRREILEAAVRCFVRHGFQGASISHICAEAGMSAGHLYHYFPSKEAIVEAIVDANLQRSADKLSKAAEERAPVLDVLTAQLKDASRNKGHRTPLLFDMFAESGRNPTAAKLLGKHSRRMQALLVDLLRRGQEQGEIDPSLDPSVVAPVLISLVDAAKTLALRYPDQSASHFGDVLQTLLSRFLSTPSAKENGGVHEALGEDPGEGSRGGG